MKKSNSNMPYLFLTAASSCKVTENVKVTEEVMKAQRPHVISFEVADEASTVPLDREQQMFSVSCWYTQMWLCLSGTLKIYKDLALSIGT